ncbi:MAG: PD-(D/E)XK nuclease family protein [Candidatus Omnitrophica bacterium]|nr:PD-(D/E)XK nuclease family protein [Candidatus Omnitrophota bacterium]
MVLNLSYSSAVDARSCTKKYYYRNILGLEPRLTTSALNIGSTVHECFEMYFNKRPAQEILQHIEDVYKETLALATTEAEEERMLIDKYTCLGMWTNYPFSEMEFEEVMPEKEFKVRLGSLRGVYLKGIVDGLMKRQGKWWIREVKTTSMDKRAFQSKASVSYQAAGYMYGVYKETHTEACGIVYDMIKRPLLRKGVHETAEDFGKRILADYSNPNKKEMYFDRYYSYRTEKEILEFERDMVILARDLRRRIREGCWYRNTDACFTFNSECPYKKICWEDSPDSSLVEALYERRKN